jgi:hypothetical protein
MPCAYWSQGPHDGWRGSFDGRLRRSPTPDELRSQAVHALATRITSLYWFNLSLKSLLKFPDTWEPMASIGREIRMLEPYFLTGDAYRFERHFDREGNPDWDLSSIATPEVALLFAIDTAYSIDETENVFTFGPPRAVTFRYQLPPWLRPPADLFRVDADGVHEVDWRVDGERVTISDRCSRDAIYVAATTTRTRDSILARRQAALDIEGQHAVDLDALRALAAE